MATRTAATIEAPEGGTRRGMRLWPRGTRFRILASVVGLLAFSTVASILIAREILLSRVDERVEQTLAQEVQELRLLVTDGRNPLTGRPFGRDLPAMFDVFLMRNVPGEREDFFTFVDGRPYTSTARSGTDRALAERLAGLAGLRSVQRLTVEVPGGEAYRVLAVPVDVRGRRGAFAVSAGLSQERGEVNDAMQVAASVSLAVLLLASLLAWATAGRILAPLRDLADTARSIGETDFTRRISIQGDDEMAQVARAFNSMLDRLEAAFDTQRSFVSDAGHELRTPITIIRGHLELLGDDPQERRETVALVTDELDRMSRFVNDLLTLAKAEQNDFLELEDLDVDVFTDELMAKARALAPRDWQPGGAGVGRITADRQRLTQAVMNLAHNAAQHTAAGDRIELGSEIAGDRVRLWVRDSGPGVAPEERERIFERFARAGGSRLRSEGAGLGLAIVRVIAEAHGGTVGVESPPGRGATFTIEIPVEPPREVPR